jgi:hypothetical protein
VFLFEKERYSNPFAGWKLALWLISAMDARGTIDDFIHRHHVGKRAAGTIDDFMHGRQGALWMTSSMDSTEEGEREGNKVIWSKTTTGIMATYFRIVRFLRAHANEKNQRIEIDKTTAWIMAMNVVHIAAGLYFAIGVSLSLSILEPKTLLECFINKKNHAGRGKKNWNQIPCLNRSWMKGFHDFVDLA